ncbi:MAG: preprotein translocase subunit SecE [Candidatus Izemoplasma sp.]
MTDKKQDIKQNKVLEIIKTEYKIENLLLGTLGLLVLILGVYLVEDDIFSLNQTSWWILDSEIKRTIFSIVVIVIGLGAFLLTVWPFFVPSFAEMKKVSWPNKKTIINHSMRVFGFIFFLSAMFIVYDALFQPLFEYLLGIGG